MGSRPVDRDPSAHRKDAAGRDAAAQFALLTKEEVLAVRLYSGPAYQPINEFLRQIFKVKGDFRTELVRSPSLTFTATVNHICHAIRKLADVNTEEEEFISKSVRQSGTRTDIGTRKLTDKCARIA